jgi:hypothetical protein
MVKVTRDGQIRYEAHRGFATEVPGDPTLRPGVKHDPARRPAPLEHFTDTVGDSPDASEAAADRSQVPQGCEPTCLPWSCHLRHLRMLSRRPRQCARSKAGLVAYPIADTSFTRLVSPRPPAWGKGRWS